MAKIRASLVKPSGALGDVVFYTRMGKTYCRRRAEVFNDQRSERQLRQRALFKAMRQTAALMCTMLQRGLAKYAHDHGMTEDNMFAKLNKECFEYENGRVRIDYAKLKVAYGYEGRVMVTEVSKKGRRVEVKFGTWQGEATARKTDVVHIYAVEPKQEVCELVASVEREAGVAEFELPEAEGQRGRRQTYYLYAMAEAENTADVPTMSADEKRWNKKHRNVNRKVSRSEFVGMMKM